MYGIDQPSILKKKNVSFELEKLDLSSCVCTSLYIQSTLVIAKSKELSEILKDIRTSTCRICRTEEKLIVQQHLKNEYVI